MRNVVDEDFKSGALGGSSERSDDGALVEIASTELEGSSTEGDTRLER
jgi:hypothetical protein